MTENSNEKLVRLAGKKKRKSEKKMTRNELEMNLKLNQVRRFKGIGILIVFVEENRRET